MASSCRSTAGLCQELSGQLVSVVSVVSVLVGGLLHNNLYAVAGAGLIILASPFDRYLALASKIVLTFYNRITNY